MYKKRLQDIIDTLTLSLDDADKFDKGVDVAGKRLRLVAQDTREAMKELRSLIQEDRKDRKKQKQTTT